MQHLVTFILLCLNLTYQSKTKHPTGRFFYYINYIIFFRYFSLIVTFSLMLIFLPTERFEVEPELFSVADSETPAPFDDSTRDGPTTETNPSLMEF